jgi:RNA polymerase sigma-70 factor (ECF subfamily)
MVDWQELVAREGCAVWQTSYRILGNRADAEECFQEVFLDALRLARRQNVEHWRAMLQRLATRRAIDELRDRVRRNKFESPVPLDALASRDPPPAECAEHAETGSRLRQALALIPERQAEVFCLHVLEGWSYREIGSVLKMPVDTVGVLLHRARKQLRDRLAGLEPEGRPFPLGPAPRPSRREES